MADTKNPFGEKKVSNDYKHTEEVYFQSSSMVLKFISESIKLNKSWSIVDLGAGTGILSEQLSKEGFKNITLVDPSQTMLDQAKAKLGGKFKYLPLTAEKLKDSFKANLDLIVSMNALHLFPDLNLALSSISSSLKNSGYFVFNTTAPSFAFAAEITAPEKKLLKANLEFYSGLAALSANPIAIKTKELLELYYQGSYNFIYDREKFKHLLGKQNLKEIDYKDILLNISNENQKAIWQMIAKAFVQESILTDKLINSIEFEGDAVIRQACFIYQKV